MQLPLIEKLQEFGLTDKEARVYLASLELGNATADQISKVAEVNRSTTYVQIEALMDQGLMSTHDEGKKTMFTAESPDNLSRLYQKRIADLQTEAAALDTFLPDLNRIYDSAGERPVVRYFQGKEGLVTMRNEVLKVKNKEVLIAVSFDYLWEVFADDMESLYAWSAEREKKKIKTKVIYTKTGDAVAPVGSQEMHRVSERNFPFESDVYIFDNKVALASLKGNVVGVIIESKAITTTMRSVFELARRTAAQE